MGYSQSKETIDRVRDLLDIMLRVENKSISFPSKNPRRLTYAIRDAFHSCEHFPSEAKYLVIRDRFKIKQLSDKITFEPKTKLVDGPPIEELKKGYESSSSLTFDNLTSTLEIIGALIQHKPNEAAFPSAGLDGLDMTKIAGWCAKNNYKITETIPLTISKQ